MSMYMIVKSVATGDLGILSDNGTRLDFPEKDLGMIIDTLRSEQSDEDDDEDWSDEDVEQVFGG